MNISPTHPLAARATSAEKKPVQLDSFLITPAPCDCPEPEPKVISFRLPYPPSANNLYGVRAVKKITKGKERWIATVYKTAEHEEFMDAVGSALRIQSLRREDLQTLPLPAEARVKLTLRLYRPQQRGDIDNPLKGLFDALNSRAWIDDKQVKKLVVDLLDDKADPRVEVDLEVLP
jgi:Holliday junction resolvase RusA-like endonuclease